MLASLGGNEDVNAGVAITALLTLPALGGTLGYVRTLDKGSDEPIPSGGLIDLIDLNGGSVRLGVPDVSVSLDARGEIDRVDVRLVGARF